MSTGKLIQHLTSKHKDLATERINSNANEGGLVPLNPNDNKESENITLLRMMLECNLPLSFVEKKWYRIYTQPINAPVQSRTCVSWSS